MNFDLNVAQVKSLVIAIAVLVVAVGAWWWLNQPQSQQVVEPSVTSSATSNPVGVLVVVDVVGAVRSPGVVQLPIGSRVIDAVTAAGGLKKGATPGINMARVLIDGEQIAVGASVQNQTKSDGKVHVNTATAAELELLPGVGPVLAGRLIAHRSEHGSFRTLADLDAVSGVGPAMLDNLSGLVSFD